MALRTINSQVVAALRPGRRLIADKPEIESARLEGQGRSWRLVGKLRA